MKVCILARPSWSFNMAAAAEIAERLSFVEPAEAIGAIEVASAPDDQLAQQRAKLLMRAYGSLSVAGKLPEVDYQTGRPRNLLEATHLAADGNADAIKMIDQNIESDYFERSFKAGVVTEVELRPDTNTGLGQHGQSLDSVNGNSWRYVGRIPQMRERLAAEARNKFRQDTAYEQGLLEDNYFVVFSCAPDDMTSEELIEEDFFVDTMSCSIQATTVQQNVVKLESAFVAGVKRPEEIRHDIKAIMRVAQKLGIDFDGKSTTEILDSPLLIPKALMPNGIVDLVALFDEVEGTFFGEDKPQEDYVKHRDFWRQRQAELKSMVASIRRQLIHERLSFQTPSDATKRLGKLSEKAGVHNALNDESINPNVFGSVAADYIQQARAHRALGNYELASASLVRAEKTAKSSSCPGAVLDELNKTEQEVSSENSSSILNDETNSWHGGRVKRGKCVNCKERTEVGVKDWCKKCISGHCGSRKAA